MLISPTKADQIRLELDMGPMADELTQAISSNTKAHPSTVMPSVSDETSNQLEVTPMTYCYTTNYQSHTTDI